MVIIILMSILKKNTYRWLKITDDGDGFVQTEDNAGNGLENMQLRAEEIYGKLTILSEKTQGTTVKLAIDKTVAKTI